MKKLLLCIIMACSMMSAGAITLFPHFVDVAGDFNDGTPPKFQALNMPVNHWRSSPYFFSNLADAVSFLDDTLPTSSYTITKESKTLADGTEIITYSSSLEADGLYVGKWSRLYLVQTPGEELYVGISEDPIN